MKFNVQANDFCPDNCPFFEMDKHVVDVGYYGNSKLITAFKCCNSEVCKYAVECYKEQERQVQDNANK